MSLLSDIFKTPCSKNKRNVILYTLPYVSSLLLRGLPSVAFVDADIARDGAGALLLTQMHPKCFRSPFPCKNAMTKQPCRNTNLNIHGIMLSTCSSTAKKVTVHCYLHFAGLNNDPSNKTYLLTLHLLPNHAWAVELQERISGDSSIQHTLAKHNFFCHGFSVLDRQRHVVIWNL